jgi:glucuronoarabinoxylan endo-1,4-beta-xylanase
MNLVIYSGSRVPVKRHLTLVLFLVIGGLTLFPPCGAQTITVNWGSSKQTIDGFGAASGGDVNKLSPSLMDFFYTSSGINLSIIRIRIYPDLSDCTKDQKPNTCVAVASGPTLATSDLLNAQAAVARGALVVAAEWSPPGSMKSNGSYFTGGMFLGGVSNFTNLAAIQAGFVTLLSGTYSIPLYAISPQNEPDFSAKYASCTWTDTQIHDYVPYLAAALATAGYSAVKIMIAEPSTWTDSFARTAMNDAAVAAHVGILASHAYNGGGDLLSYRNVTNQHQWETEASDFSNYDGSIRSGLHYATQIYNWMTKAQVNGWLYWLLSLDQGGTDNEALTDHKNNIAKRAYTLGNYSKFVRPGWHRVDVANTGPLLVSAYENSQGTESAMVVVNNSGSPVKNQTFSVGTAMGMIVTPWLTSSDLNLANRTPTIVSAGSFTYTIPAHSVMTFSGHVTGPS